MPVIADSTIEETAGMEMLCPSCARPIGVRDHFCPECGVPLTSFAATDPLASIRSEAEMVRRAFQHPSLFKLIGVWLIFGPMAITGLVLATLFPPTVRPIPALPRVFDTFAMGVLYLIPTLIPGAILWRMTARYRSAPLMHAADENDDIDDEWSGTTDSCEPEA